MSGLMEALNVKASGSPETDGDRGASRTLMQRLARLVEGQEPWLVAFTVLLGTTVVLAILRPKQMPLVEVVRKQSLDFTAMALLLTGIFGIALQQCMQLFDPIITRAAIAGASDGTLTTAEYKSVVVGRVKFTIALLVVLAADLRLVELALGGLEFAAGTALDVFFTTADYAVSALAIGEGAEATNSIVKLLKYIKEGAANRFSLAVPEVTSKVTIEFIEPPLGNSLAPGTKYQFNAVVTGVVDHRVT
jgi:hypothetical protein